MTKRWVRILLVILLLFQPVIRPINAQQTGSELNLVNLILDGNETRTIRDTRLNIEGIIEVKENATLILENVRVRFIESELDHAFKVNDNASLILFDSDIERTVIINQSASLNASNSMLFMSFYCTIHGYNHTTGGVIGHGSSKIMLDTCNVGYLWLHDNSSATVDNSFIYYSFPEDAQIVARDSTIQNHRERVRDAELDLILPEFTNYTGRLDSILPSSNSVFENVTIVDGLWLITNNSTIQINDSRLYLIDNEHNSEIILDNVTLNSVSCTSKAGSFKLSVDGCNISQIVSYWANDTIIIDHSRIGRISLWSYKLSLDVSNSVIDEFEMDDVWFKPFKAYIKDSCIGFFRPGLGNEEPNEYVMDNVTLLDGLGFNVGGNTPEGGVDLHGELRLEEDFSINQTRVDGYAIINRFYPVLVNSSTGPVANVSLVALNGNRTLWTGETSGDGVAEVPVRYVNIFNLVRPYDPSRPSVIQSYNITDTVTLSWSAAGNEGSLDLDLLSDTPIVIEVPDGSGNGNLLVLALVGIIVVAVIFYNKR